MSNVLQNEGISMKRKAVLHQNLVTSLEEFSETSRYRKQIRVILTDLKKDRIVIPASDYENVINFILVLMKAMPGFLNSSSSDQKLIDFCKHCMKQIDVNAELKAKFNKP